MSFSILNKALNSLRSPVVSFYLPKAAFSSLTSTPKGPAVGGAWSLISMRTNIRNNFPRAREGKRIKVYGWWKRMSTAAGRRVLMRRILKGRHVLSH